jgi:hypothetical protein
MKQFTILCRGKEPGSQSIIAILKDIRTAVIALSAIRETINRDAWLEEETS